MATNLAFVLGVLAGVALTLAIAYIAAVINWLMARHDR